MLIDVLHSSQLTQMGTDKLAVQSNRDGSGSSGSNSDNGGEGAAGSCRGDGDS